MRYLPNKTDSVELLFPLCGEMVRVGTPGMVIGTLGADPLSEFWIGLVGCWNTRTLIVLLVRHQSFVHDRPMRILNVFSQDPPHKTDGVQPLYPLLREASILFVGIVVILSLFLHPTSQWWIELVFAWHRRTVILFLVRHQAFVHDLPLGV